MLFLWAQQGWYWQIDVAPFAYGSFKDLSEDDDKEIYGFGTTWKVGYHYALKSGLFFDWQVGAGGTIGYKSFLLSKAYASHLDKKPLVGGSLELTSLCVGTYLDKNWAVYGLANPLNLFITSIRSEVIKGFGLKAGIGLWHKASGLFFEVNYTTPIWSKPSDNFGMPMPVQIVIGVRESFNSSKAA